MTVILVGLKRKEENMADYQKMYAVLCAAVDAVIDPLQEIPEAAGYALQLRLALEKAEELYIQDAPDEN